MWQLVVSGMADTNGLFLTPGYSTPSHSQTANLSLLVTENMKMWRNEPTTSVWGTMNMAHSHQWCYPWLGAWEEQQQCASRGWPHACPKEGLDIQLHHGLAQMLTKLRPTEVIHPVYKRGPLCFRTNSQGPTPTSRPCVLWSWIFWLTEFDLFCTFAFNYCAKFR